MRARGFVFSLDAFVAFVLIMVTVNLLIFTIGTPKPYLAELESAHILAHDTLSVLASSGDDGISGTYLERIMAGGGEAHGIMMRVAGGDDSYRPIIPRGFGYRLEYLDVGKAPIVGAVDAAGDGEAWHSLYDAGTDGCPSSDRCGKRFTKLSASATVFLPLYTVEPRTGESPFCYASCKGYEWPDINGASTYASTCNVTPCDTVKSNFLPGENSIQIVRLVVYT